MEKQNIILMVGVLIIAFGVIVAYVDLQQKYTVLQQEYDWAVEFSKLGIDEKNQVIQDNYALKSDIGI